MSQQLQAAGHEVLGITRSPSGGARLTSAGVRPIIADAMDRSALLEALRGVSADAVVHQLTALTKAPARHSHMAQTNRLRTEGTENLLAAARAVGAGRFVTQSIVFGYGYTDHADLHNYATMLRKRKLPIPARRNKPLSWIHINDAASATAAAIEDGHAGAYNVVDDRPASWSEMFTATAEAFDAPPPRALPGGLIRIAAPYVATMVLDTAMRVSNAKAKSELGWQPAYPSFRDGLAAIRAQVKA